MAEIIQERLLNVQELADALGCKPSWVYGKTRINEAGAIPMIRVGKYCRFQLSEVLAWLRERQECAQ
jgi:excisionase family DNA binding protein